MILYVNTTANNLVEIGLKDGGKFIARKKFSSDHTQAEKLLPGIAKLLKARKFKLSDLKGIEIANRGGSFTSLRIGVVTANALAYALRIPIEGDKGEAEKAKNGKLNLAIVRPEYESEPVITIKKTKNLGGCGKDV